MGNAPSRPEGHWSGGCLSRGLANGVRTSLYVGEPKGSFVPYPPVSSRRETLGVSQLFAFIKQNRESELFCRSRRTGWRPS